MPQNTVHFCLNASRIPNMKELSLEQTVTYIQLLSLELMIYNIATMHNMLLSLELMMICTQLLSLEMMMNLTPNMLILRPEL